MPKCVVKVKSLYVFKGMQDMIMEMKSSKCCQVCRNSDMKTVGHGKSISGVQYLTFFLNIRFCPSLRQMCVLAAS